MAKLTDNTLTVTAEVADGFLVFAIAGSKGLKVTWPKAEWGDLRDYIDAVLAKERAETSRLASAETNRAKMQQAALGTVRQDGFRGSYG